MSLRQKINKIVEEMELVPDSSCGDPECCGERGPDYIGGRGLEKCITAILSAVEAELPNEAKQLTSQYGEGWNACLEAMKQKLKDDKPYSGGKGK